MKLKIPAGSCWISLLSLARDCGFDNAYII